MSALDDLRPLENLRESSKTVASLALFVAADVTLRRTFRARAILFPSSLAGMLAIFPSLCAIQRLSPALADRIDRAASPAVAFIGRWLALFFAPTLVVLPLVLTMSLSELGRLLLLIGIGMGVTLPVCALAADTAIGFCATPDVAPPPPPPRPPNFLTSPSLKLLLAASASSGVAAVVAQRAGAPFAPAIRYFHFLTTTSTGFACGGGLVPKRVQRVLHPLITAVLASQCAVGLYGVATGLNFVDALRMYLVPGGSVFAAPGNALLFLLGPATLSFAFQMFARRQLMVQSAPAVASVTGFAAITGLAATALVARLLQLSVPVRLAAVPRLVTTPLAVVIAGMLGADPSLAATIVVITGLIAANFGRSFLDALNIRSPVARGLAMGAAGHGLGTAAMVDEKQAFPFAAIAMALNAALSSVLVSIPAVRRAIMTIAGAPPV